ncbi:MAG: pyridoxal phosphate-dependent aminotransferase [Patescibacteria group bacterium]|nr:pyridoxal phosphate-dependent aminotransferase [Patescibacteria group bacterium]MCL5095163.1 pyridoxal phosphate-dependent aminotransferase [Patescibacteria group bacterium]
MKTLKFTERIKLLRAEGAYQVLAKAEVLEKQGKKIIHFEIGQPDFPTPKNITQAGIKALQNGLTKYNPPLGISPLREALAKKISKERKINVFSDSIAVTPSGKTAIFVAMAATIEKGDEIIYPNPGFPTYETLVDFFGGMRKPIPLLEENSFGFDMRIFKKHFSKKTKLVILNSPSNPTGGVMSKSILMEIAELVKKTKTWVLTDEIYSHLLYDHKEYESIFSLPKMKERTIIVDGFSKTYSMTGWRLGYLVMPPVLTDKIDSLLTHLVGCTATFTQYAGLEALTGPQKEAKKMVFEFEKRRDIVVRLLNNIPGVSCQQPEGAFYVFPNIKKFKKSSAWLADYLLNKAQVALLPGTAFGKYGEGYLRISYATSIENLKEGLKKIKIALAKI